MEHGQNFGARIDGQPEHLAMAAQPGANFIQLQVREVQVAEAALMEELSVLACPREPPRDGRLTVTKDAFGRGWVEPFGQRREDHGDLVRRGFQTIQGRVVSSAECGVTGLATKGLDLLSSTMLAIPDESVHSSVSLAKVRALPVRTGEALGIDAFRGSPPAFDLAPGSHKHWGRHSSRRGSGGETTGGAIVWRARLQQTGE
jgi:hypothetical protein